MNTLGRIKMSNCSQEWLLHSWVFCSRLSRRRSSTTRTRTRATMIWRSTSRSSTTPMECWMTTRSDESTTRTVLSACTWLSSSGRRTWARTSWWRVAGARWVPVMPVVGSVSLLSLLCDRYRRCYMLPVGIRWCLYYWCWVSDSRRLSLLIKHGSICGVSWWLLAHTLCSASAVISMISLWPKAITLLTIIVGSLHILRCHNWVLLLLLLLLLLQLLLWQM